MTKVIGLFLCFLMSGACLAVDEDREPPLKYTLNINGKTHEINLDTPLQLQGVYRNPRVILTASSIRVFRYGGVRFHYPAAFSWEAEIEGAGDKTWTLSGNDFKIMYFVQSAAITPGLYVGEILKRFGKEKTRVSDTERKFGDRKYKGKLLFINLGGINMIMEIYLLPAKRGSRLLVLQDSPPDGRVISVEGERTTAMLAATFKDTMTSDKADAKKGK
jgi:hypothetical protein